MKAPYILLAIHMVVASLLGWVGIVSVLVADIASLQNILICIIASFIIAAPIALAISKRLTKS